MHWSGRLQTSRGNWNSSGWNDCARRLAFRLSAGPRLRYKALLPFALGPSLTTAFVPGLDARVICRKDRSQ